MQAESEFKSSSNEERQGRAIAIVGAVITLMTLVLLLFGLFNQV